MVQSSQQRPLADEPGLESGPDTGPDELERCGLVERGIRARAPDDTIMTVTIDSDPPLASAMEPMAGSDSLRPFDDLILTFNEFVQADTGNITARLRPSPPIRLR